MRILSWIFGVLGIISILFAFYGRLGGSSMVHMLGTVFSSITLLVFANTCLLLAILLKMHFKDTE